MSHCECMLTKTVIGAALVTLTALPCTAIAVDSCGGQTSSGNPFPCSSATTGKGGNCTWWAAKKANENWPVSWSDLKMRGNANTWDDEALKWPNLYTVSPTPVPGSVAVDNSAPYQSCTTCPWEDYGHVAWVQSVSGSNITISQMVWGKDGVTTKTVAASTFQQFITKKVAPTLTNLTVTCPSSVAENTTSAGICTAKAYYSNNTNKVVTSSSSWADNSSYLSVSAGKISTKSITKDQAVNIGAVYNEGGISKAGSAKVTIKNK